MADVPGAITGHALLGFAAFAEATAALALAAQADCAPDALRPAHHAAFDARPRVPHLTVGPPEDQGLSLASAFWPDPKGLGQKALNALTAAGDPAVLEPEAFAQQSIAVRGIFTLERLLHTELQDTFRCALVQTVTADLAASAALAALDRAVALAGGLDHPVFAGATDPAGRLRVEILQQADTAVRAAALA